jgi:hypothetical protein
MGILDNFRPALRVRPVCLRSSRQGQTDNSPAFQRRVIVAIGMSPAGTADWTAQHFHRCQSFHLNTSIVPSGLGFFTD